MSIFDDDEAPLTKHPALFDHKSVAAHGGSGLEDDDNMDFTIENVNPFTGVATGLPNLDNFPSSSLAKKRLNKNFEDNDEGIYAELDNI